MAVPLGAVVIGLAFLTWIDNLPRAALDLS
ncbi:hypothetical protein C8E05_4909 [Rhodococcus wratislaviensis]|uniref:Uncharacterized protein n=1 Tax=Rhodococcus wratislaviensis TaxID=44752 RepID=A0AB38FDW3_RHOWR|nr:hypothetical protein C8E05_4909 [Rhodococcus wratislaviensis]SPZ39520.1 Uncharacterised protein [Rhodococcus wratislaviensis]